MEQMNSKLNVLLYDNPLTPEKNDYSGRVQINGTITNAEIATDIVSQRTEYRYETILNILTLGDEIKINRLSNGFGVKDGVSQIYPAISGRFMGAAAKFDSTVHSVGVTMYPSGSLRTTMNKAEVNVQKVATVGPVINKVLDVYTEKENSIITLERNLKIFGECIRIVGESELNGIWFIKAEDPTVRIKVDSRDIVDNNPSQLTVVASGLTPGDYYIEVVTQSTSGQILTKEPRSYRFEIALAVS